MGAWGERFKVEFTLKSRITQRYTEEAQRRTELLELQEFKMLV